MPYITEDQSTTPYTIAIGNTGLVAEHANDYDVLYERYFKSVGDARKQDTSSSRSPSPSMAQQSIIRRYWLSPFRTLCRRPRPAGSEWRPCLRSPGLRLPTSSILNYLPGPLSGARIIANFAYTDFEELQL